MQLESCVPPATHLLLFQTSCSTWDVALLAPEGNSVPPLPETHLGQSGQRGCPRSVPSLLSPVAPQKFPCGRQALLSSCLLLAVPTVGPLTPYWPSRSYRGSEAGAGWKLVPADQLGPGPPIGLGLREEGGVVGGSRPQPIWKDLKSDHLQILLRHSENESD